MVDTLFTVLRWLWANVVPVLGILGFILGVWNLALSRAKDRRDREKDERERKREGDDRRKERDGVESDLGTAKRDLLALDNAWKAADEKFGNDRMLVNRKMRQAEKESETRMHRQGLTRSGFHEEATKHARGVAAGEMAAIDKQYARDHEQYEADRKLLLDRMEKLEGKRALQ